MPLTLTLDVTATISVSLLFSPPDMQLGMQLNIGHLKLITAICTFSVPCLGEGLTLQYIHEENLNLRFQPTSPAQLFGDGAWSFNGKSKSKFQRRRQERQEGSHNRRNVLLPETTQIAAARKKN